MNKKQAPIITFYSFKGGVGRSMAVANVAWLLAQKYRKKVVVVDWDLEAPGLHRFFDVPQETIKNGLIDLLYDYKELLKAEHKTLPPKLFALDDYLIRIEDRSFHQGSVSILCAGRQDKEYAKRVNEFNWEDFYNNWHGFGFIDYLKTELKSNENIDVVLLDSRTGITDIGGICTLQLPEVVVLLFALNEQNINGIETTIQGIYGKATIATERKATPELILRPARVERYLEQDQKGYWEGQAAKRLGKYLPTTDRENPLRFMKQKSIPYIGGYGFGETPLAVVKDPDSELGAAFDDLTKSVLRTSGIWSKEEASADIDPEYGEIENPNALELLQAGESSRSKQTQTQARSKQKKWTLMFFFASDNILSPSTLTQIKAIKAAGYQQNTNVLLHFDPNEKGAPTRVFEVNRAESQAGGPSRIGDSGGPLVSFLTSDDITSQTIKGNKTTIEAMQSSDALSNFLDICRMHYPAEHYMLFLIGDGMVIGRDSFLPDENPVSAIGLVELGTILKTFSDQIRPDGVLELIGMNSCSMSGLEIAYELQDTASYMLASQGVSLVGAWPYRQLLITIYNAIEAAEHLTHHQPVNVLELAEQLHSLCIQHSADFMIGGYSADLCLSTLNSKNVGNLDASIQHLAQALTKGLAMPRCRELILLAHWKSQSYWQDTYTDLYDFCLCLSELCREQNGNRPAQALSNRPERVYDETQRKIEEACTAIMRILKPKQPTDTDGPIVRADFVGPATQYSHGVSIYFPWMEPIQDKNEAALKIYGDYEFSTRPATKHWLDFLTTYFRETKRQDRLSEDKNIQGQDASYQTDPGFMQVLADAREAYKVPGTTAGQPQSVPTALDGGKVIPPDSGGGACTCTSTKNYPRVFSMSPGAWGQYSMKVNRQA